jgi:hypothetical protein
MSLPIIWDNLIVSLWYWEMQLGLIRVESIFHAIKHCNDNTTMIGAAAYHQYMKEGAPGHYLLGGSSTLGFEPYGES